MKYPAYPKYKDSGVEWLGEVPEHWEVKRVGMITDCLDGQRIPLNGEDRSNRRGHYPYWGANGIVDYVDDWIFNGPLVLLGEDGAPFFDPYKPVAFYVNDKIWVNNHAHILSARGVDPVLLTYALNQTKYEKFIDGSTRDKLTQEDMRSIPIACPPPPEQRAIAAFLDAQTSKLDTLIAKERELIDKLKEKRAALITRTVTRGLPPDAAKAAGLAPNPKMKDSGVEWLGEVPEHWDVSRFSREVYIAEGQVNPELEPYLNMFLIAPNHIESETGRLIAKETATEQCAESGKYYCKSGDVIYSKIRPSLAKVAMATEDCLCSADMYPLRGFDRLDNKFLYWILLSRWFIAWSILESDRVAMPKINRESLGGCQLCIPTLPEQRAIVGYLDRETASIDALVAKVETAIDRLQEYRAALITSAVTGKIDVRQQGD